MKNVFALDRRTNRRDGEKFIARTLDREHTDRQKRQDEEEALFERTAGLPVWVNVCGLIAFCLGSILLCGFFEIPEELTFQEAFARLGWCLIAGAALMIVGGAVLIASHFRTKQARASSAYAFLKEKRDRVDKESYSSLGVSESAKAVDVIGLVYKSKPNKKPYKENGFNSLHVNLAAMVYTENNALCFAMTDCVYCIPLEWILNIKRVDRSISAAGWNKGETRRNKLTGTFVYNGCKIRENNGGGYSTKPYYRMAVRDENYEEYYILIPCYEIEAIASLTGKTVE